jgi:hypothetical protein
MTKLSPAAQAIHDAYWTEKGYINGDEINTCIANLIRALADQVVPWRLEPTEDSIGPTIDYGYAWGLFSQANDIRQELIKIADEFELQDLEDYS